MIVRIYTHLLVLCVHILTYRTAAASSAASRQQREESPSRADEQDNSIIQDVHPAAQIFASTRVLLLCDIDEAICTAAASFLQSGGAKVFRKVRLTAITINVNFSQPPRSNSYDFVFVVYFGAADRVYGFRIAAGVKHTPTVRVDCVSEAVYRYFSRHGGADPGATEQAARPSIVGVLQVPRRKVRLVVCR